MAGKKATISVNLIADATKARAGFKQAEDAAGALDQQFKNVAKTAAAAFGTAQVIRFGKDAVGAASDLAESMNAVNVTFEDAADGILKLGENAADTVGLSAQQFNSFAVEFAGFTKQIADSDAEIIELTDDLTVRIADFASVMNLDVPEAATVFRQALSGETEGVKRFGIDLSAAAVQSYALANGITDSASAMTESEKVLARYELLMESTEQMSGDFANTSDGLANSQRILKADLENLKATVGEAMVPALEALMGAVKPVLEAFTALPDGIQQATVLAGAGVLGFKSLSTTLQGFGLAAKTANKAAVGLGVTIGAGVVVLNQYMTAKNEVAAAADRVKTALDAETGAVTENTDNLIRQQFLTGELGKAMEMLGLDVDLATEAVMGNDEAAYEFIGTLEDARDASVGLGDGLRSLFTSEMQAIDAARIVSREYQGMYNGFSDARTEAERLNDAMTEQTGIIGDVDESAKYLLPTVEDVTAAIQTGTGAVEEQTEAQKDFADSLADTMDAMFGLSEEFKILMGQFDNDDAIAKMDEALTEVIETVAEFGEGSAEAEQAIRDFADDVENTIITLGNVPTSVTTQIAMAISDRDLQRVDSLLNYYAELARVTAGTITSDEFFQSFGGELGVGGGGFNPADTSGYGLVDSVQIGGPNYGAAAGMVTNVTVNAGMGTDGDEVARQIVEVLNDFSAGGGAKLDANVVAM